MANIADISNFEDIDFRVANSTEEENGKYALDMRREEKVVQRAKPCPPNPTQNSNSVLFLLVRHLLLLAMHW